jgi:hypothetical protein
MGCECAFTLTMSLVKLWPEVNGRLIFNGRLLPLVRRRGRLLGWTIPIPTSILLRVTDGFASAPGVVVEEPTSGCGLQPATGGRRGRT